jgi:choice-of-anchor C domain-containing protein
LTQTSSPSVPHPVQRPWKKTSAWNCAADATPLPATTLALQRTTNIATRTSLCAGYYDVTAAVTGSGLTMSNMAAGEVRNLGAQFTAASTAPNGTSGVVLVTATSAGDAAVSDAVSVGLRVVSGGTLADGGFEEPDITPPNHDRTIYAPAKVGPWTVSAGSVDVTNDEYWQAAEGDQSLDVSGFCTDGTIYQDVGTTPGQDYEIRFMLAGNTDGSPTIKQLEVSWGGAQAGPVVTFDTSGTSSTGMGYVEKVIPVTASAPVTRLQFRSVSDSCYGPVIDDVRLVAVA